ncbi:MAG: hypothetical protein LUG62_01155 [Clostridiales bacterium]|nr:hypothetical protein [Clostridiales bacterium]
MGEDEYWERRREELENPMGFRRRSQWDDDWPAYKDSRLYLDDEAEEIEAERGYPMEELAEGDLLEIVSDERGIVAVSAVWNASCGCIEYRYRVA